MPEIHATSHVGPECELADGVVIGPHCTLTGRVKLGPGVQLLGHVYIQGPVEIGARTFIYPFTCIGFEPQDVKFTRGETATAGVVIGSDCKLREHVTIHASTKPDVPTRLGDRVWMMVGSHVAHDCRVGNDVNFVNNAGLAGHVQVGDKVTLAGHAIVHQFVRMGRMAFMSAGSAVSTDVPPFCIAWGRNSIVGLNVVGLRRSGMDRGEITLLRRAFREVLRENLPRAQTVERLREIGASSSAVMEVADFVAGGKRPICPYRNQTRSGGGSEDPSLDM
jgi:UDP-N-acetylglucosamine acyltransferase